MLAFQMIADTQLRLSLGEQVTIVWALKFTGYTQVHCCIWGLEGPSTHVVLSLAETLEHPALVILKTFAKEACGASKCQHTSLNSVETHFMSAQVIIRVFSSQRLTSFDADLRRCLLFLKDLNFVLSDNPSVFSLGNTVTTLGKMSARNLSCSIGYVYLSREMMP